MVLSWLVHSAHDSAVSGVGSAVYQVCEFVGGSPAGGAHQGEMAPFYPRVRDGTRGFGSVAVTRRCRHSQQPSACGHRAWRRQWHEGGWHR